MPERRDGAGAGLPLTGSERRRLASAKLMTPSPDRIRSALDRATTVDITTTGRRTGEPTCIEIWMFKVGDRYVITGTPGPRDWYANVLADPRLMVHLKGALPIDLEAVATPILDPDVRREVLSAPTTS
jgi:hypothetical protein